MSSSTIPDTTPTGGRFQSFPDDCTRNFKYDQPKRWLTRPLATEGVLITMCAARHADRGRAGAPAVHAAVSGVRALARTVGLSAISSIAQTRRKIISFFERLKAEASAEWRATEHPSRTGQQTVRSAHLRSPAMSASGRNPGQTGCVADIAKSSRMTPLRHWHLKIAARPLTALGRCEGRDRSRICRQQLQPEERWRWTRWRRPSRTPVCRAALSSRYEFVARLALVEGDDFVHAAHAEFFTIRLRDVESRHLRIGPAEHLALSVQSV